MQSHPRFTVWLTAPRSLSRDAFVCGGTAAMLAAALAWFGPPDSDMAAHAYQRGLFLERGLTVWNNFWYAGHYSFVTYSVLYYPLAALLGIRLLAVATVATAASAFAVVIGREWGPTARWSSRTFAIVWTGIVLAAAFPFALGVAFALLALSALQEHAQWRFVALTLLTLAASPLAFAFLTVIAVGAALAKRVGPRLALVPAAALVALGGIELVLWRMFPDNGRYPFSGADLAASCAFSLAGAALVWRNERGRALSMTLLVYGFACVVAYLIPSALGSNITRLQFVAIPIAVLVASLRSWRPLPVCLLTLALAVSWNVKPLERSISQGVENEAAAGQAYWQPAIRFLHAHLTPSYRVEAVDTVGHWPAEYLPTAGIPIVRGWFRQDDFPDNSILYSKLTPERYAAWLRGLGVRYVLLSRAQPDYSAVGEANLLRSGRSGLRVAFQTQDLTVFAVPAPTGILSGGPARVVKMAQARLELRLAEPGRYRLAIRYSPYWQISSGCVIARRDGMSEVLAPRSGTVVLTFHLDPERALATLVGRTTQTCAAVIG